MRPDTGLPALRADTLRATLSALLFLLLATLPSRTLADNGFAPPYPIIDSSEQASLGLFIAVWEDPSGSTSIEDVHRLPPSAFRVAESESLNLGFTGSTWWFRLALQNTRDSDETLLLGIPTPSLALVEFYRPVGSGYALTRSGTSTERVVGDFDHRHYLFGVSVPANTTEVFWFRVRSDTALDFRLTAEKPESFTQAQSLSQLAAGAMAGLLAALALINLLAFAATRRAIYLWYGVSVIGVITYLLARMGFLGVLFLRGPGVQPLLESTAAVLSTLAALQFARVFLDTRQRSPRMDTWLLYLLFAGTVIALVNPLLESWQYGRTYTAFAMLAMPLTMLAALPAARRGCADARRYLGARVASAAFGGVAVLHDSGLLNVPFDVISLLVAGGTIEALLLLWAIYLRDGRVRRDRHTRSLSEAVTQAESRARSEFLSHFGHDVRTPLNGILGMTELLVDTTLTPRQREYAITIRSSGEALLALLNEAIDWTRLESGQLELQSTDFDLAEVAGDCVATVRARAEEKHLEMVLEFDPALPVRVVGDPARIRQVLCNLLANAVRYTNRGEVHVQVSPGDTPVQVRFEVRDTGVGIARDRLATLFEPDGSGRGFGLVVARRMIERMGGTLGVQSEEHRGSTFWFALPLPAAEQQAGDASASVLAGKRLLIVDDNNAVRRVIETQATGWGMSATSAENGQEALALARTQANLGTPFDAVIVDHNMPGMSGLQLAARIKEDPLIRHDAAIVMLTGLNIAPTETMARNVGIRRVLTKPVSGRTLQGVLVEEIARNERLAEDAQAPATQGVLPDNLRVLVVEDNHLSQKVIRGMLGKLGVRSDVVSNGQEAVEAVQHHRYDLVLMDCEMPVLDGYDATRRIRAWESDNGKRRTPVIALSAHILHEIKERCRQAGMDGHMAKPLDLNELRETLRAFRP